MLERKIQILESTSTSSRPALPPATTSPTIRTSVSSPKLTNNTATANIIKRPSRIPTADPTIEVPATILMPANNFPAPTPTPSPAPAPIITIRSSANQLLQAKTRPSRKQQQQNTNTKPISSSSSTSLLPPLPSSSISERITVCPRCGCLATKLNTGGYICDNCSWTS